MNKFDSHNVDAPHTQRELEQAEGDIPVKSAWVSTSDTRTMGEEIGELCILSAIEPSQEGEA